MEEPTLPGGVVYIKSYCIISVVHMLSFSCFLSETVLKFRALKKPAQLAVINSLEKVGLLKPCSSSQLLNCLFDRFMMSSLRSVFMIQNTVIVWLVEALFQYS